MGGCRRHPPLKIHLLGWLTPSPAPENQPLICPIRQRPHHRSTPPAIARHLPLSPIFLISSVFSSISSLPHATSPPRDFLLPGLSSTATSPPPPLPHGAAAVHGAGPRCAAAPWGSCTGSGLRRSEAPSPPWCGGRASTTSASTAARGRWARAARRAGAAGGRGLEADGGLAGGLASSWTGDARLDGPRVRRHARDDAHGRIYTDNALPSCSYPRGFRERRPTEWQQADHTAGYGRNTAWLAVTKTGIRTRARRRTSSTRCPA
ncbi:hypothetical protein PVAP13_6KG079535 [Panicum virgatum]|uniref:Uncharacterized protein n=1 Tax=Panicum virgatum TaxID=38727 RepID=A0A8T0R869_PANVG|nr:hypothetical protein PVAP13_6KG079535 [Panicum virgatum]